MEILLQNNIDSNRINTQLGRVASYIPILSKVDSKKLGIYILGLDGKGYGAGDFEDYFTIQSISKVIILILAIMDNGKEAVFDKIGIQATDAQFNSVVALENIKSNKPLNPMINAGAIATTSLLCGETSDDIFNRILDFTRKITGNNMIHINEEVYESEKRTGDRNRSLAYFMKSTGLIETDVDEVLDIYFKQCSIEGTCIDVAHIGAMLANDGVLPWNDERVISVSTAKIVKGIMTTCGMYEASAECAIKFGLPSKSGVGGGILCAVPKKMGIGVFGPALDDMGNSVAGIKVLEKISKDLNLSIF